MNVCQIRIVLMQMIPCPDVLADTWMLSLAFRRPLDIARDHVIRNAVVNADGSMAARIVTEALNA